MTSATLTYETPHFLQSLIANDSTRLKTLGEELGVRVTSRDAWVKLEGPEEGVEAAKGVFSQLEKARRGGAEINGHFFRFALDAARSGDGAETLQELTSVKLLGNARKPPVLARTRTQLAYLRALQDYDVVFGIGPAGTGKTYLAMASALAALKAGDVQRIVLTRPAVEAGEALGFLPGDLNEKILPYLRPLYDALYDMLEPDEVERMIERGTIEIAPLAFMRGRTLSRSFIILDEAQNTTKAQMFMFLTRLGEDSRCVITGDPSQIDLKKTSWSGLLEAMEILKDVASLKFVEFQGTDVVRHPVVRRIIEAYDTRRAANEAEREAERAERMRDTWTPGRPAGA